MPPPRPPIRGVYAITPDESDTDRLVARVQAALAGGIRLLQYRNKTASPPLQRRQLEALRGPCTAAGCLLIVNDDWRLAAEMGFEAVHVGRDDDGEGDLARIRDALGPGALIGVSCYASLERAGRLAPLADYLAFGAMFRSGTKPQAPPAPLSLLGEARRFGKPVVAIGGIDAGNAARVIAAGADAVAMIGAVFGGGLESTSAQAFESADAERVTKAVQALQRVCEDARAPGAQPDNRST